MVRFYRHWKKTKIQDRVLHWVLHCVLHRSTLQSEPFESCLIDEDFLFPAAFAYSCFDLLRFLYRTYKQIGNALGIEILTVNKLKPQWNSKLSFVIPRQLDEKYRPKQFICLRYIHFAVSNSKLTDDRTFDYWIKWSLSFSNKAFSKLQVSFRVGTDCRWDTWRRLTVVNL